MGNRFCDLTHLLELIIKEDKDGKGMHNQQIVGID